MKYLNELCIWLLNNGISYQADNSLKSCWEISFNSCYTGSKIKVIYENYDFNYPVTVKIQLERNISPPIPDCTITDTRTFEVDTVQLIWLINVLWQEKDWVAEYNNLEPK